MHHPTLATRLCQHLPPAIPGYFTWFTFFLLLIPRSSSPCLIRMTCPPLLCSHAVPFHGRCDVPQGGYSTRQGQPIGCNLTCIRSNAHAVDRSLALNIRYSVSEVRAVTVRVAPFRASAISRGNFTEHPQDRRNTRRSAVHPEVCPSKPLPAQSPRRVRVQPREQFAFKMRFRIANPWINRCWVNCNQVSFWLQKQDRPPSKSIISR